MNEMIETKRTKDNDIIFMARRKVSLQNTLLIIASAMLLLCFGAFVRLDLYVLLKKGFDNYEELRRLPNLSLMNMAFGDNIIYYMLGEGAINDTNALNAAVSIFRSFVALFIMPVCTLALYFANRKIAKDQTLSYKLVMLQYSLILLMGGMNFILLRFLSNIIKFDNIMPPLGSTGGAFKLTFIYTLYAFLNTASLILSAYGIIYTGTKESDETLVSEDIFSAKTLEKIREFTKEKASKEKASENKSNEVKENKGASQKKKKKSSCKNKKHKKAV